MKKNTADIIVRRGRRKRKRKNKYSSFIKLKLLLMMCCCLALVVVTHYFGSGSETSQESSYSYISEEILVTEEIPVQDPNIDSGGTEDDKVDDTSWNLLLVNKWNAIPDDYEVELTQLENGQSVDSRIYPALQKMFEAAREEGIYPVVASGYRTTEKQQQLMDEKIRDYESQGYSAKEAITKAEAWVAIPGTSEHQLGISVDINADGIKSTGKEVYDWLGKNAYKFGFINRYSSDKTEITGVINEPWHYRYVGTKAAEEIQNMGVCLEEYLDQTFS